MRNEYDFATKQATLKAEIKFLHLNLKIASKKSDKYVILGLET